MGGSTVLWRHRALLKRPHFSLEMSSRGRIFDGALALWNRGKCRAEISAEWHAIVVGWMISKTNIYMYRFNLLFRRTHNIVGGASKDGIGAKGLKTEVKAMALAH